MKQIYYSTALNLKMTNLAEGERKQ